MTPIPAEVQLVVPQLEPHRVATGPQSNLANRSPRPCPSRWRWLLRTWSGGLLLAALAIGLLLAGVVLLAAASPSWYQPLNPAANTVLNDATQAQAALLDLRNQAQNPRWRRLVWRITQDQMNALLAVTYSAADSGAARQHRPGDVLARPFVRIANHRLILAIHDRRLPGAGIISVTITIHTSPNGPAPQAHVRITGLRVGLLPLPPSLLTHRLAAALPRLEPSLYRMLAVYLGRRYARDMAPQMLRRSADFLHGQPFPLELRVHGHGLVLRRLDLRGGHINRRKRWAPAALTVELVRLK